MSAVGLILAHIISSNFIDIIFHNLQVWKTPRRIPEPHNRGHQLLGCLPLRRICLAQYASKSTLWVRCLPAFLTLQATNWGMKDTWPSYSKQLIARMAIRIGNLFNWDLLFFVRCKAVMISTNSNYQRGLLGSCRLHLNHRAIFEPCTIFISIVYCSSSVFP